MDPKYWSEVYEAVLGPSLFLVRPVEDDAGSDSDEETGDHGQDQSSDSGDSHQSGLGPEIEERYGGMRTLDELATIRRQPAILQTNSQIYNEASSMLYSGLQLVVRPGDALMNDDDSTSAVKGTRYVWRHLPSRGLGRKNANGLTRYEESDMYGAMEPHVFTKFERVRYEADFNYCDIGREWFPEFYIDKDSQFLDEEASKVIANFKEQTMKIIQAFVNLLSKSPLIKVLEVALSVEIKLEDFDEYNDDGISPRQQAKGRLKQKAISTRAYELMLENGVLEPLRQLTNVKSFVFDFTLPGSIPKHEVFHPQQKHVHIIRDLKAAIEHNWAVGQDSS